jgi:hypothetical protein
MAGPVRPLLEDAERALASVPPDFARFSALWANRGPQTARGPAAAWRRLGERVLRLGEPLLAYDVLREGLDRHPSDIRLRQLLALSLARSGAVRRANELMAGLRAEGHGDEETLGILARTHKDLAAASAGKAAREHLGRAARTYLEAFRRHGGYYSGINAAATALFAGRRTLARALAREVRLVCRARARDTSARADELYWLEATLAEAALILGDTAEALERYSRAAALGRGRHADLSSTRAQALRVARCVDADPEPLSRTLRVPAVVAFTGHMIDAPGRRRARFPAAREEAVRLLLREALERLEAGVGYSAAACGADILFAEELLRRGAELRVVLPFKAAEFRRCSVDIAPGWGERFERVLRGAAEVVVANDFASAATPAAYGYGNEILDGLARLRASSLGAAFRPLAVWDGLPGDGPGGTASMVRHWRAHGDPVEVLRLSPGPAPARAASRAGAPPEQRVRAMLFADAVGFSRLHEAQIPLFSDRFMAAVARFADGSPDRPLARETWGDAVYFVFKTVSSAGRFALGLRERIGAIRWADHGLPDSLAFRIALHAGPVFERRNPVTGRPAFIGTHVSRAARIEPVTPPGQVYASLSFAALAAAQRAKGFSCEYVGVVPLAKHYGSFPLYHLRSA